MHCPRLSGHRVRLSPFTEHHVSQRYVDWLNNPELMRFSENRHRLHSLASCQAYQHSLVANGHLFWAIERLEGESDHIGNLTVHFDLHNGLADVGILLGERALHGQGYGLESWQLACTYLLQLNNVRKVTAGTLSCNLPMLRIMEKTGMVPDGERINHYLVAGKPVHVIYRALFR
jgi:RimJ/RimL family protein N-acetyltransferase